MKTHRANVTFVFKESEAAPLISIEQMGGDEVILQAAHGVYLELSPEYV